MMAIVELLYRDLLDHWHRTDGLLERDEHQEYYACCRFAGEQQGKLKNQLDGETAELFEAYLKNMEQARDVESRLCFARGLAMGLSLGGLADGR